MRDEFPTWNWIIEGMLRRAGFRIDLADYRGSLAEYLCTKHHNADTNEGADP